MKAQGGPEVHDFDELAAALTIQTTTPSSIRLKQKGGVEEEEEEGGIVDKKKKSGGGSLESGIDDHNLGRGIRHYMTSNLF